ncbi:MAG TPA: FtsX-like permease family protein, partial [Thermoanaerobaculia bacterium]
VEVARKLNLGDPIGKLIFVDGTAFTVVGVMEKRGSTLGNDEDDLVLIPFATATILYGQAQMKRLPVLLQVRSREEVDLAKAQIREILRARHNLKKGEPDDFRVDTQEELLKSVGSILLYTTLIMGSVVGIALLVGGIGIMNIMLVSVTERTREIGIRKSLGARRNDVLIQFLIEAIALSGLGGIVGILGGAALANIARLFIRKWVELPPVHTPIWAIALAFGFCALLGIIFGIYPAAKASKLDPIEALRYE